MSQTIYEKTIGAEEPYEYIVGAYADDEGARYFRVLKVIPHRGWIETNLTLSENQDEILSAISEAVAEVQNPPT